jgi:hypothetical protein
LTLK